jgi:hypothetical protein
MLFAGFAIAPGISLRLFPFLYNGNMLKLLGYILSDRTDGARRDGHLRLALVGKVACAFEQVVYIYL